MEEVLTASITVVLVARRELIRLSHSLVRGDPAQNSKSRESIERELGIRTQ